MTPSLWVIWQGVSAAEQYVAACGATSQGRLSFSILQDITSVGLKSEEQLKRGTNVTTAKRKRR